MDDPEFASPRQARGQDGTKIKDAEQANDKIKDQYVEKLQSINIKLRNRIKDLNVLVDKALEKQTQKFVKNHGKNSSIGNANSVGNIQTAQIAGSFDPEHLLAIRQKEVQNSQKQIQLNQNQINKLKTKIRKMGANADNEHDIINWELKYQ